ncbi:MAG TPA: oligosaccharide flippase family protein, partial [Mucilaginibacter sp.]|nr:oligosaccharide flippase family protein [Mucilaginibacter sp.]
MNTFSKHTLIYLFSKGLPGFISFVAILYYSKMLEPADYGKYSLVISVVGVINIIFCEWFRYGVSRFYPESMAIGQQNEYLLFVKSIINYFTIAIAVATLIFFLAFDLFFEAYLSKWLVLLMGLMVFLNFAFNLFTQIFVTELRPIVFSKANFLKTILGVGVSVVLVYLGYNFVGLFVGLTIGFIFSVIYSYFSANFPIKPSGYKFNKALLRSMALYSLPLTASAGLSFLVNYASRFIIGYFRGVAETGLFTLGYDFTQQTIGVFIGIAATSSLPIAMKLYTEKGNDETFQSHMSKSISILFFIALPIVVVFAGNSTEITTLLLGGNFRKLSPLLIPVSAIAA